MAVTSPETSTTQVISILGSERTFNREGITPERLEFTRRIVDRALDPTMKEARRKGLGSSGAPKNILSSPPPPSLETT